MTETGDSRASNQQVILPARQAVHSDWPDVMTEHEAIQFLRLDLIDIKNPSETLAYYRRRGLLRGTQIGKSVRYLRKELHRFLDALTEGNPR